jgi:hypothetical protein
MVEDGVDSGADDGSASPVLTPQHAAFMSSTTVVLASSDRGGCTNRTAGCGDGAHGSDNGMEVLAAGVDVGSGGGCASADLMPTISSSTGRH